MSALLRLLCLLTIFLLPGAHASDDAVSLLPDATAAVAPSSTEAAKTAAFTFTNRKIFVFRAALAGYPPDERASGARHRLQGVLAKNGPLQTGTRTIPEGTQVLLDGVQLFVVIPGDVNQLAGDTTDSVAKEAAGELRKSLLDYTEQSSWRYLAIAAAVCAVATLVFWLVWAGLTRLHRWAKRRSGVLLASRLRDVRLKNVRVLDAEHYIAFAYQLLSAGLWALRLMATYVWVAFVLGRLPYTRAWGESLSGYLLDVATDVLHAVIGALPGLLLVCVIFAIARLVAATASSLFKRVESGELQIGWLDKDTAMPTRRIASVVIWLFALAMAYPYLPGSHTAAFQGLSVLVGLMVSIGASSIVGQGASGLILMYTRALRKGEYVRVGESEGTVVDVGMFETRLRTGLGEEVALPNAWVMSQTTKNYSRALPGGGFVLDASVTIGYATPWRQVHAMLELAAARTTELSATPKPYVMQLALHDYYVQYRLVAYASAEVPRQRAEVLNRLHQNIIDVFNEFEVQITSPHYIADPEESQVLPREEWFRAPAKGPEEDGK
ncbi:MULTISPECIES: mechanosensitive ion channel family protein [unclassified Janthinobacterium]|uniref:mechanosensitive ion channel family protein n=1 Tax=unclassified Janthinobacterium TaxID=2610881 RepID=UPI001618D440|nr:MULTISPECIES: mechanosensitive ion channel domain-containing protein [unclassified Janthinobacterium]MBB5607420.1 small-conductance mechanosensitive channel [Janthinobacterium sp. S3T4]MBB5612441.1 small-conductance mechanosensitive channel [Janthinobacterium sp. S3M3]